MKNCAYCGTHLPDEAKFCKKCGNKIAYPMENPNTSETPTSSGNSTVELKNEEKKKFPLKLVLGIGIPVIAIVLILAIVAGVCMVAFSADASEAAPLVYMDNGDVYCYSSKNKNPFKIATYENGKEAIYSNDFHYAEKSGRLFFPSTSTKEVAGEVYNTPAGEIQNPSYIGGYTLSYINSISPGAKPKVVAEEVDSYLISDDGEYILYSFDDVMYWGKVGRHISEIEEEFEEYSLSANGKNLYYLEENSLYNMDYRSKPKRIDGDVQSISYISKDHSLILYEKDGDLYASRNQKSPRLVGDDFERVVAVSEKNEVYFMDNEGNLLYCNGKTSELVGEGVYRTLDYSMENLPINLVRDKLIAVIPGDGMCEIIVDGKINTLEIYESNTEKTGETYYDKVNSTLYFVLEESGDGGTLYKAVISGNNVNGYEEIDKDVSRIYGATEDGRAVYTKSNSLKDELYIDKALMDNTAGTYYVKITGNQSFFTGIEMMPSGLYEYDGATTVICDNVAQYGKKFDMLSDGTVVYVDFDNAIHTYKDGIDNMLTEQTEPLEGEIAVFFPSEYKNGWGSRNFMAQYDGYESENYNSFGMRYQ